MARITDLSGQIKNGLWSYKALPDLENIIPEAEIKHIATVEKDDFFASRITVSTITGTYLEAGSHILPNGKLLDEYEVTAFIKPAKIIRLPKQEKKAIIDEELLKSSAPEIHAGDAVIVETGWGEQWDKPGYVLDCPNFLRNGIDWLISKGISIFGVDVPAIEASWSEEDEAEKGGLLGALFENNILLLAPLVNLSQVKNDSGTLICLPMNVEGTSGAPVRAVFVEGTIGG